MKVRLLPSTMRFQLTPPKHSGLALVVVVCVVIMHGSDNRSGSQWYDIVVHCSTRYCYIECVERSVSFLLAAGERRGGGRRLCLRSLVDIIRWRRCSSDFFLLMSPPACFALAWVALLCFTRCVAHCFVRPEYESTTKARTYHMYRIVPGAASTSYDSSRTVT